MDTFILAAGGCPPASARLSVGSAGYVAGPCLGSSSPQRCSSRAADGTLSCPCSGSASSQGSAGTRGGTGGGSERSPGEKGGGVEECEER